MDNLNILYSISLICAYVREIRTSIGYTGSQRGRGEESEENERPWVDQAGAACRLRPENPAAAVPWAPGRRRRGGGGFLRAKTTSQTHTRPMKRSALAPRSDAAEQGDQPGKRAKARSHLEDEFAPRALSADSMWQGKHAVCQLPARSM